MRCDHLGEELAGAADGSAVLEGQTRLHVEHCLRCQVELVQNRKLLRALRSTRTDFAVPSGEVLPGILLALGAHGEAGDVHNQRRRTRTVACLGGIAAATAAGAAGAIVLASRSRRRLPLAG